MGARHPFGGGAPDWTISTADGVPVSAVGGASVTAWNQQYGGTQYTDLSFDEAGSLVVDHVTSSDGTDGMMLGQIPIFWGPPDVWEMWLSANGGPRARAQALDVADKVATALDDLDAATVEFDAMHDSIGQPNGLATLDPDGILTPSQRPPVVNTLSGLTDVAVTSPAAKDVLSYDSATSRWMNVPRVGAWTTITSLASGYVAYDPAYPPQCRFENGGATVRLRGLVKKSSGNFGSMTTPLTVATLPSGFVPITFQRAALVGAASSNINTLGLSIVTDGTLALVSGSSSYTPAWIALDGATYSMD